MQRNILVFELLLLAPRGARVLAVHPFTPAPSSWRWEDRSRSPVEQTGETAIVTRAGRMLRSLRVEGTFGVQTRASGLFAGDGESRRRRFESEIVRLPDAYTVQGVGRALDNAGGSLTPGLRAQLAAFNPATDRFAVNLYDLWHGRAMEVIVRSFDITRAARQAAASGATFYAMQIDEVGPLVRLGGAQEGLAWVATTLARWRAANDALAAFSPATVVEAVATPGATVLDELTASLAAVNAQTGPAVRLARGAVAGGPTAQLRNAALALAEQAAAVRASLRADDPLPAGIVNPGVEDPNATAWRAAEDLVDVQVGAEIQPIAGAFVGLEPEEWAALLAAQDRPARSGSRTYRVSAGDVGGTIEVLTGIPWADILRANGLLPSEALTPGRLLRLPEQAAQAPIDGLPVLGSHAGTEAWGRDADVALTVDGDDLLLIEGNDVIRQGVAILLAEEADVLLGGTFEGTREDVVSERARALLLADPRIEVVERLDVVASGAAVTLSATVRAIHGAQVEV